MRVLHVTTPARFGGLERVVTLLAEGQSARGDEIHVASLSADADAERFFTTLTRRGIEVHPGAAKGRDYLRQHRDVERLTRTLHPDVVHTHGYRADVLALAAAHRAGRPVVTTLHGFTGGDLKNRCYEWLQRQAVRRHDGIVAVSEAMAHQLSAAGIPSERVRVIPNVLPGPHPCLDRDMARRILGLSPTRYTIGWVGRVSPEKGLDLLLEALAILGDTTIDLAVIGDGPARRRAEHQATRLGMEERIHWCGAIPGADRFLAAFDLLVLSSRSEGSPVVLLEAMAAAVPILATAVGGVPETVSPDTAILVAPEDPAAIAAGIREVRQDPAAAAGRTERAQLRCARRSDPAPWVTAYDAVYTAAIQRRRVRG